MPTPSNSNKEADDAISDRPVSKPTGTSCRRNLPVEAASGVLGREKASAAGNSAANHVRTDQWLARRLANRWTRPILGALYVGPRRFAQLKRALYPVSQRMLTLTLRKLEKDGLVCREVTCGKQPQVTYGLTAFGTALAERLIDFDRWTTANLHLFVEFIRK